MRNVISLSENWTLTFPKGERPIEAVTLPHTWNAVDGMNGNGGYLRTTGVYSRTFTKPEQPLPGGQIYVEVLAAALRATILVNGTVATTHEGGYSIFRANITDLCEDGENTLTIELSNEDTPSMYPASADFTFYGGLYRGVNLISVPKAHFDLDYYGSSGIKVTPKPAEDGGAVFVAESFVTNPDEHLTVLYSVTDPEGREVAAAVRPADSTSVSMYIPDAKLWSMDTPNFYTVTARLQRNNETCDEVCAHVGVRSFAVTPDGGFSINGVPTPLRGVSRHQDRLYKGSALTAEDHYQDAQMIKELGANTIRLAHYQHSQDFYNACDELGFAVWAEIPFISVFKPGKDAHAHCRRELTELIVQNYNHPSILFWGISNEILIGGISQELIDALHDLQKLCKKLDPTRLTTIAHLSGTPTTGPMHRITDLESYNHYFGWYGGKIEDNGSWLDKFHKENPDICLGISEYGCESVLNWHSSTPQCRDYTEEYQCLYHEYMVKALEDRPWIWASHVWNMFDFGCAARKEGSVTGRNNKGLVTIDRKTRKDSFYIYQAYWSKAPMIHIAGRRYAQRAGETTEIKIYSNQDSVTLFLNGKSVGTQCAYRVFHFQVALDKGFNTLLAVAGSIKDSITLEKVDKEPASYTLQEFSQRQEGVANWFKQIGSMDLTAPMTFPEGRYSVRDTMEEIAKNEEAFAITAKAIKLAINVDLKPDMDMWNHDQSHNRGDCYKNGQSAEWFLGEPERPAYQNQKAAIKFAPNPGYFIWYWGHILALISSAKYRFELLLSAIPRPALVFAGTRFPTSDRSSHRPHHG